jgi:hypothetical protein
MFYAGRIIFVFLIKFLIQRTMTKAPQSDEIWSVHFNKKSPGELPAVKKNYRIFPENFCEGLHCRAAALTV